MSEHKYMAELPLGYSVEWTWQNGSIQAKWSPRSPGGDRRLRKRKVWRQFLDAYQAERAVFLKALANKIGSIAVADTNGEIRVYAPTKH